MITLLHTLGLPGIMLSLVLIVLLVLGLLRLILRREQQLALSAPVLAENYRLKKYPGVDLAKYRTLILNISLIISLLAMLAMFEFPSFEAQKLVLLERTTIAYEEMYEIPPTEQLPPPPPSLQQPDIIQVPDEVIIEREIEVNFDVEVSQDEIISRVESIAFEEKITMDKEEEFDQIFEIVEEPAAPLGGYPEFYAYISQNLKYPRKALDMNVGGRVFVKFVVDRDGSLTMFEVVRGIGYGCDEEAVRVLQGAPKWKPGKQRGRPVRQQMIIPIVFRMAM